MRQRFSLYWRLSVCAVGYALFGIGALFIAFIFFPIVHLVNFNKQRAYRQCQFIVYIAFRVFVWYLNAFGLLNFEVTGAHKLKHQTGKIFVANHPTLLDVVFIISLIPQTMCVVKKAAWSNPFLAGIMWGTGYIQNGDPLTLIDNCVENLENGSNLLIFPEATRSVPGQPMKLKRGAASIIAKSKHQVIPVMISCTPVALYKSGKWYDIALEKVNYKITVGNVMDPQPIIEDGAMLSASNRRINKVLRDLLLLGTEQHERAS